ncbi:MAG TPA: hypothetical protein VKV04_22255 [Verrucomicrobiae bacterium]|nr:hypothetical protein [Verrucomicrobiae bacterium]
MARQQLTNNLAKLAIPTNAVGPELRNTFSGWVTSGSEYFDRIISSEAEKQLAVGAIALKRYRLKHGKYPSDLAAMVPEFIPEVLRDPIDNQPLRYRLNPDGSFLLYSIGKNGKDDSGDATSVSTEEPLQFRDGRDWVWPQRATPQEIQNSTNHSPK